MAHRYLAELGRGLVDALLGAMGTLVVFRLGPAGPNAECLRAEFSLITSAATSWNCRRTLRACARAPRSTQT